MKDLTCLILTAEAFPGILLHHFGVSKSFLTYHNFGSSVSEYLEIGMPTWSYMSRWTQSRTNLYFLNLQRVRKTWYTPHDPSWSPLATPPPFPRLLRTHCSPVRRDRPADRGWTDHLPCGGMLSVQQEYPPPGDIWNRLWNRPFPVPGRLYPVCLKPESFLWYRGKEICENIFLMICSSKIKTENPFLDARNM